jgi:hypothetical protein
MLCKEYMQLSDVPTTFDVDDESLDRLTPREAFVLGVEWAIFFKRLKSDEPIRDFCLSNNSHRLEILAARLGRPAVCHDADVPSRKEIWIGKPQPVTRNGPWAKPVKHTSV